MFTLHGSKTLREIPSFFKLLGNIKIDGLCIKKPDDLFIIAPQASYEIASPISGIENMEICKSLLLLTHFFY